MYKKIQLETKKKSCDMAKKNTSLVHVQLNSNNPVLSSSLYIQHQQYRAKLHVDKTL